MLRLFVVVVTVAIVSGIFHAQSKQQTNCCSPPKWEIFRWGIGGAQPPGLPKKPSLNIWSTASLAFDRDRQRFYSYENYTVGTTVTSNKIIEDYQSGYKYTLDVIRNVCVKANVTVSSLNSGCLPDSAVFLSRVYYGVGDDSLYVKVYKVTTVTSRIQTEDYIMVSDDDCIQVSESIVGSINNVALAVRFNFLEATPGIKDPSVFNIPDVCRENATIGRPESRFQSLYNYL